MLSFIKAHIAKYGMISYHEYMELALYHPNGYYMKEREKVGKEGDFYTSSNLSVFAYELAHLFIKLVEREHIPPVICELGGGTGVFAYHVLTEWERQSPQTFAGLTYYLVETSPYHRKKQRDCLQQFSCVRQLATIDELSCFSGIMFANELFDAFPVHIIERQQEIYEIFVSQDEEGLCEVRKPLKDERILSYLQRHNIILAEGQRFEIALAMEAYVKKIAHVLESGMFLMADYGYTREEWSHPARREGSLRGYFRHKLITNPLLYPGDMDLTTHIDFDVLQRCAADVSLTTVLQMKQADFLVAIGMLQQLVSHADTNPFSEASKRNRAIRTMLMGELAHGFHVLLFQKHLSHVDWSLYVKEACP